MCSCRRIIWIDGPYFNSSVTWISFDGNNVTINDVHPNAISVDPVSGEIYLIDNSSILSIDIMTNVKTVFRFDNAIPVALDVFEIFAYVLLDTGIVKQVNIQSSTGSQGTCNVCMITH